MKRHLIAVLAALAAVSFADVSEGVLNAISKVESNHNDAAVNVREDAVGRYQIQQSYFYEAKRIAEVTGKPFPYTLSDRSNASKSKEIVRIYLNFWGRQYRKARKAEPTAEVYFKIHNGHAFWRRKSTDRTYFRNLNAYAAKALNAMVLEK